MPTNFQHSVSVAIIADTHGSLDPRIAEWVAGCDCAVHGGDVGNAGVLERLRPLSGHVIAVRGNNDVAEKWPEGEEAVLSALPESAFLELPGGLLAVDHGHRALPVKRRHAVLRKRYPEARAVVYGHSHRLVLDLEEQPWILNPGAAGRARTYGGPSCILLTAATGAWTLETKRFPLQRNATLLPSHPNTR